RQLHFFAYAGFVSHTNNDQILNLNKCQINLHVPPAFVVWIRDVQILIKTVNLIFIDDNGRDLGSYTYNDYRPELPDIYSFSSSVNVRIELARRGFWGLSFQFRFSAVSPSVRPQLEVVSSPAGVYVQTPGWNGRDIYPDNMDSWARVDISADHSVMITILELSVNFDRAVFDMYIGGKSTTAINLVLRANWGTTPHFFFDRRAGWMNGTSLHVHFVSIPLIFGQFTGFQMLFSFHNDTALPKQLSVSKWNCSVPYWDDFRRHFQCDFKQDCVNGEDERDCLYKNHTCGEGWVLLEGKCYLYVRGKQHVTWNDASAACHERGGYLASLNTPDEYVAVMRFLAALTDVAVYVGLRSPSPSLPRK
ncbi:hypothetical protein BaRGS_00033282, partial [Batillaria attramentaria]